MIGGIARPSHQIAGLEFDKAIRAGSDWLQVSRRVTRARSLKGLEQMFGDDHAELADKSIGPERCRLFEADTHSQRVELFDRRILVAADRRRRGRRVAHVLPVEQNIVTGERAAIMPLAILLEL